MFVTEGICNEYEKWKEKKNVEHAENEKKKKKKD